MATLGPNDLKQYALPSYWDAAELSKIRLESGETYEQFLADVAQALAMQNQQLLSDPMVGMLVYPTTDLAVEYRIGVSNGFQTHTEYGVPDPKRAATTGHMLYSKEVDRAFGWTWDFLRKARRVQLDADIASGMEDIRNEWRKRILQRLFKSTYTAVGSSGRSMPVCDGGTADSAYVPINHPDRATAFAYTHTHLGCLENITQANLQTGVEHVWHHGHDAPYDLIVAQADIGSWINTTNVTGYVARPDPLIRFGATRDYAEVDANFGTDGTVGVIETAYGPVRLHVSARIPTAYWSVFKSYGTLDQRNPMAIRYDAKFGIGAILLAGDHIRQYPLENAMLFMSWGENINDRTAAYICYNTSPGSYTDPTIV